MKRLTKSVFEKLYISLVGKEKFKRAIALVLAGRSKQLFWFDAVVKELERRHYRVSHRVLVNKVKKWYGRV